MFSKFPTLYSSDLSTLYNGGHQALDRMYLQKNILSQLTRI